MTTNNTSSNLTEVTLREVTRLYLQLQREDVSQCEGTTLTQCQILTEVGRNGVLSLAALSRKLGLDKSWTSRAVDNLVEDGLITKTDNSQDRRTINISLTKAGQMRFEQLNQMFALQIERVMAYLPHPEREQAQHILGLLQEALTRELQRVASDPERTPKC